MTDALRIWYVAGQRLCNFDCPYCVSTGDWSKSRRYDWTDPADRDVLAATVGWIGSRPHPVEVRLGSLGEPFASSFFLQQAGWLTRQDNVRYVELLSNASLLERRLPLLAETAEMAKVSLWLTWHPGQISLETFTTAAALAHDTYGCFVVVNVLLFSPAEATETRRARDAALAAGLRFNLDLGYDPDTPTASPAGAVPLLCALSHDHERAVQVVTEAGGDTALTRLALTALAGPRGLECRAGHDYLFIDIHGVAYRCSRYAADGLQPLGSVLDPDFRWESHGATWAPCAAEGGCCNKEDFLNLRLGERLRPRQLPSLGWTGA
ncbi:hypothetical protein E0F15_15385 [Frankia sp. B2]|uniref:hypothetical protein n=1 Tax=Frankia sp. B2 TaxID=2541730 RepID=UPI00106B1380|nr:hypothetical protein [Frankia sp. B2]TFE28252.1 hypothetical protein E0F15_15385 [Frankia sp. B2]